MSGLADRTRRDVDRRVERLRAEYGEFPVVDETVENEPDYFEEGLDRATEGWRGDAGCFVRDDRDRALFIRHEATPETWGTPGGGHEPGEPHARTARREVREETGVDVELLGVVHARRRRIVHAEDPDRQLFALTVEFEGEATGGDLSVDDDEVLEARWFEDRPDAVSEHVEDRVEQWADRA